MKHTASLAGLVALALAAPACLENEEEIEIRADGSVRVVVTARGDLPDLANGYPVPLAAPWRPKTLETERWLRELGMDTGSAAVRERLAEINWPKEPGEDEPEAELRVAREFGSVEEWPRWFAPEGEPYRTASLARDARLEIREQGERKVYVFERVYRGTDYGRLDPSARGEAELEGVWAKFDERNPFSEEEWQDIRDTVALNYMDVAELFVRDAVIGVFTEGDASLSPHAVPGMVAAVRRAADEQVSLEELHRLNELMVAEDEDAAGALLEDFEREYRDTIRSTLATALVAQEVDEPTTNAVLFALEWGFTSFDHYGDLGDETFEVTVAMPGVLVGGNFHNSSGSHAEWSFDGEALQQGDVVMRAVSVLE